MEENKPKNKEVFNTQTIVSALILVGALIAGAILLKDSKPPVRNMGLNNNQNQAGYVSNTNLAPVSESDMALGNPMAPVTLIVYEDFQCPFCAKLFHETEKNIIDTYVRDGSVRFVYRDFAFLGGESVRAAEAARCAAEQGKFWEYHDFLFNNQDGENQGGFADLKLKSFAKTLGLDTNQFNSCFDSNKYESAVIAAKNEGNAAGVSGTPKGFIIRDGKIHDTIDGAEDFATVKTKIDLALR